jgi:hypothetical protein
MPSTSPFSLDRVVRTDLYFDGKTRPFINEQHHEKFPPSIGTAWIANPKMPVTSYQERSPELLHLHELPISERLSPEEMIEAILQGIDPRQIIEFLPREIVAIIHTKRLYLTKALLAQRIVIERSPPLAFTLANILRNATSTSLGVLVGTGLSPDPFIMSIAIPAGILLMGPIMGISKGLERGLARLVEEKIAPPKRQPRRAARKRKAQKDK